MERQIEFFGRKLNVYKANLHTHTTISDGKYAPHEVIKLYSEAGYDVMAFTDHSRNNPVSTYDHCGMTLISGMEMHPMGPRDIKWHLLAVGVPEDFSYNIDGTGQEAIDSALASGAVVFCAHPYWCGFTSAEVGSLEGISGIEIYNSSCLKIGREYNMQCFDELLDAGKKLTAIAVDDVHGPSHLFRGFTMICAEDKSEKSLLEAIRNGQFYASEGPLFKSLTIENNVLKASFTPVVRATVLRRRCGGTCFAMPDMEGPGTGSPEIDHLELDLSDIKNNYVRIQLCDASGRFAWTNPLFL